MEKEFKKGVKVIIKGKSQAYSELLKDEETRLKWESNNWIGYVCGEWKHHCASKDSPKCILVGVRPTDPDPDHLFSEDLKLF